jgi:predicted membrane-bound spermidine synthase
MSLMFFAMGLGSRVSLIFRHKLLDTFIIIEFSLSLLCASAAILAYGLAAYTVYTSLLIYTQAFFIGLFIGLEIPLVIRLNNIPIKNYGQTLPPSWKRIITAPSWAASCLPFLPCLTSG